MEELQERVRKIEEKIVELKKIPNTTDPVYDLIAYCRKNYFQLPQYYTERLKDGRYKVSCYVKKRVTPSAPEFGGMGTDETELFAEIKASEECLKHIHRFYKQ